MTTYTYRCADHGAFDVSIPMGKATASQPCPGCGAEARRLVTAPALGQMSAALGRAIDSAGGSAETPAVVHAPPPRPSNPTRVVHPATRRLPRP